MDWLSHILLKVHIFAMASMTATRALIHYDAHLFSLGHSTGRVNPRPVRVGTRAGTGKGAHRGTCGVPVPIGAGSGVTRGYPQYILNAERITQ